MNSELSVIAGAPHSVHSWTDSSGYHEDRSSSDFVNSQINSVSGQEKKIMFAELASESLVLYREMIKITRLGPRQYTPPKLPKGLKKMLRDFHELSLSHKLEERMRRTREAVTGNHRFWLDIIEHADKAGFVIHPLTTLRSEANIWGAEWGGHKSDAKKPFTRERIKQVIEEYEPVMLQKSSELIGKGIIPTITVCGRLHTGGFNEQYWKKGVKTRIEMPPTPGPSRDIWRFVKQVRRNRGKSTLQAMTELNGLPKIEPREHRPREKRPKLR